MYLPHGQSSSQQSVAFSWSFWPRPPVQTFCVALCAQTYLWLEVFQASLLLVVFLATPSSFSLIPLLFSRTSSWVQENWWWMTMPLTNCQSVQGLPFQPEKQTLSTRVIVLPLSEVANQSFLFCVRVWSSVEELDWDLWDEIASGWTLWGHGELQIWTKAPDHNWPLETQGLRVLWWETWAELGVCLTTDCVDQSASVSLLERVLPHHHLHV